MFLTSTHTGSKNASPVRKSYARLPEIMEVPNLIDVQLKSFRWLQEEGLKKLFNEIFPISDFTGNRLELDFINYEFRPPRHSEQECRHRDLTYSTSIYVKARLLIKSTGEIKEESLFLGSIPLMTAKGTFITSGAERVVVSQLLRSPGVSFILQEDPSSGRELYHAKLIPTHGAWLEFDTSNRDVISAKIDGKRRIPITTLLRAIGYSSDEELVELFSGEDTSPNHRFIQSTMERDHQIRNTSDALLDIYKRLRPGDPLTIENAQRLIKNLFFDPQRYDLGEVGRYKLNKRLEMDETKDLRVLDKEDIVNIIRRMIMINNDEDTAGDIDHLGNRRVCTVGELIQNQLRIGLLRLERIVKERMSILSSEAITPSALVNARPIAATIREFFGSSQLSQFMDQTNPLAEITHKRRLSAMGPGGLSRERAGFEVRDVHFSHYGRICPIETPEGPNIGLIGSLSIYSRINKHGFIETPYRWVINAMNSRDERLKGKTVREPVTDDQGEVLVEAGVIISDDEMRQLSELPERDIKIIPFVTNEIIYLTADEEDKYTIAQSKARLDSNNQFVDGRIEARLAERYLLTSPEDIELMDVSPKQIFSVATALIPFLEHNDANRALMGSNMQRQAVPLLRPEAPLVATGMEMEAARYSGEVYRAINHGIVNSATSSQVVILGDNGDLEEYPLFKFVRTNQGTCINQHPIVSKGDRVEAGQVIADGSGTEKGELALGQNVLCAFMSWEGYNYEDAIIISNRLVEEDKFTSIHISKHEIEARRTKLGFEEITRDIPNVGEESLRNLDENGIIRIGADVGPGDILVGKITPKGETELSAEEKLLRAIFGEKAREVKDTSLRMPHGVWGKVTNVKEFSTSKGDDLPAGVDQWVQIWVAQKRKVSVGDKLAGRHGNKGVVSIIAPVEDMPFLPDGTPVDIILNPIGVPSRMNLGQVLETHLGWAADTLGIKVLTPVFDGADDKAIEDALARAWLARKAGAVDNNPGKNGNSLVIESTKEWISAKGYDGEKIFSDKYPGEAKNICLRLWLEDLGIESRDLSQEEVMLAVDGVVAERNLAPPVQGKVILRDGHTGKSFDQPITVGSIYMIKLNHLVEDKVHARSTGPYSLISQQPLGGKAQFGGQRFGEMEVWALEAYGAAHNLQEILTNKSDDVSGRAKTYEAIVKNEDIVQSGVPESFKVLIMELRSLGLAVEVLSEEEERVTLPEETGESNIPVPIVEAESSSAEEVSVESEPTEKQPDEQVVEQTDKQEAEVTNEDAGEKSSDGPLEEPERNAGEAPDEEQDISSQNE